MYKLIIHNLGPVTKCEITCEPYMVLTGPQASGKSTIAKSIYLFRTIKEDIFNLIIRQSTATGSEASKATPLYNIWLSGIRDKFLRIFGSSWGMEQDMKLKFQFSDSTFVQITLKEEKEYNSPNYIWIDCSSNIRNFLNHNNKRFSSISNVVSDDDKQLLKAELCDLFSDPYEIVYIPAGRSMITLLATQLNYIYSTMEDEQKRTIDFCTRSYLERILKLKPQFESGLDGLVARNPIKMKRNRQDLATAQNLIRKILNGSYLYNNGEERLDIHDGRYVKINFTSSGQQEAVWILNLLFYYMLQEQPVFFIIEEPESHLFPDAQKDITDLISLLNYAGHEILITTHSPYVLGSLNNLLYAAALPKKIQNDAEKIINSHFWIKWENFGAWYVEDGQIQKCMDEEIRLIQNERIDKISHVINAEYDKLFELSFSKEKGGIE